MKNKQCPICGSKDLKKRPETLRDSEDIIVSECSNCSHVFLDSFDHINEAYFDRGKFMLDKPFIDGIEDRLRHYEYETRERADRIGPLLVNKRVLDFGCGAGALLSRLQPLVKSIDGIEPTEAFRMFLTENGANIKKNVAGLDGEYDVILMFHVMEHLPNPVEILKQLGKRLSPKGIIYAEVPNVNDALVSLYNVDEAKKFLFFTDHLQYFSRQSLSMLVKQAGLKEMGIWGHNRFNLANHLYWLSNGKPGGHKQWSFLETPALKMEYARALAAADLSDSLVTQICLP
jgi:2-polyprenyl-3-methyl-5-hydroxy-6-metoxy-1,4-benzoquinol methylase